MNPVIISNSYTNTAELLNRFPVVNSTPVTTEMEKNIQNRLLNGFENWNRGTAAWMEWGNILYTPDSLYNVHGVHLTLGEYQMTSNLSFKSHSMMMGNFNNMVICGDWCAIRYDISSTDRRTGQVNPGSVMEFVHFKDYGEELGTRVVEGWAGTKGPDYSGLMRFLNPEEAAAQNAFMEKIANLTLTETEDLTVKYYVANPTPAHSIHAEEIRTAILNDFEAWNRGAEDWAEKAGNLFSDSLTYHTDGATMTLNEYVTAVKEEADTTTTTRLYFENMLISGDWAAIHYRICKENRLTKMKEADNVMQFLHFAETADGYKVVESWTK